MLKRNQEEQLKNKFQKDFKDQEYKAEIEKKKYER